MSDVMLLGVLRMPPELWQDTPLDVTQRHSRYVEAADLIERLRAELASQRITSGEILELHRLRAEVAALKKDAERYRWLRSYAGRWNEFDKLDLPPEPSTPEELDAAIDAALAKDALDRMAQNADELGLRY